MTSPVNFVYLITDQQRADYLGCYGHPVLRTPHIDGLAREGVRCDRFFVASPVCMPNRASLFTGRYPSVHGARCNGVPLPAGANTMLDVLAAGGYRTALIGKSHVQNFTSKPAPMGASPYAGAPVAEAWKDDGADYHQEQPARYAGNQAYDVALPYYGFQHADLVTGHGDQCGGHYAQWLHAQDPDADRMRSSEHRLAHDYTVPQAVRTALPEALYPTAYVRDQAVAYIRAAASEQAPFFAFVSFPDPHHPFTPPGRYWDMYDPADMRADLPYQAHRNPPPHLAHARAAYLAGEQNPRSPKAFMADDRQVREAMALTCGSIAMIDDAVGAIVGALEQSDLARNTVVVFNSDHGEYMGDFDVMLKGVAHFQSLVRVPFIWRDPDLAAAPTCDALLSTVDVAPSIIERAGLGPYNGIQGQSFLPVLAEDARPRESLLVEHEDNMALWGFDDPAQIRTLLTGRYRLSVYRGVTWGELYDLSEDPRETLNLWDDAAHRNVRQDLMEQLVQQMIAAAEKSPWPDHVA